MSCRNGYHVRGMNDSTQGENWWKRLSGGLKRTSSSLGSSITAIVSHRPLEPETLDSLEDELVRADLGQDMAVRIVDALSQGRYPQGLSPDDVKGFLAAEIEKTLTPVARPLEITARPFVILVSGVNGSGKTTTIGKLAARFRAEGKSVMLVAGDTFRAAAIDQLKIWGERTGAHVMAREPGADTAGLAPGDIIIAIDGKRVSTPSGVARLIGLKKPGDTIRVTWVDRLGNRSTASVRLASGPPQ